MRLPPVRRRRHGDQPAVAPPAGGVAAGAVVVVLRADAPGGAPLLDLLRHAPGPRRREPPHPATCSTSCGRPPGHHLPRPPREAAGSQEPPLGFFRGFVLEKAGEHRDALDIKRGGILAVVELARVHALALGSPAVNTQARIEAARAAGSSATSRRRPARRLRVHRLRPAAAPVGAGAGRRADRQLRRPGRAVELREAAPARGVLDRPLRAAGARAAVPDPLRLVIGLRRSVAARRERAGRRAPGPLRDLLRPRTRARHPARRATAARGRHRDDRPRPAARPRALGRLGAGGRRPDRPRRAGHRGVCDAGEVGHSATVHGLTDDALSGRRPWRRCSPRCSGPAGGCCSRTSPDRDRVPRCRLRAALGGGATARGRRHLRARAAGARRGVGRRVRPRRPAAVGGSGTARAPGLPGPRGAHRRAGLRRALPRPAGRARGASPGTTTTLRHVVA